MLRATWVVLLVGLGVSSMARLSYAASSASDPATHDVSGTVKDALGRPIAQARVTLENSRGAAAAKTKADAQGHFVFKGVARGVYAIVARRLQFKPGTAIVSVARTAPKPIEIALQAEAAISVAITAQRLNRSRNALSPETGGSVYRWSEQAIHELPQSANTSLNELLLQAPGVVQDTFGQVHVRGDHGNLQFRINGIQLPEGTTGFGQVLSPRFAHRISLLTGALPAQFGLRTAGVIDIKTKEGGPESGGLEFYGGQRGTEQPSIEYRGSRSNFNYFVTANYRHADRGLEPPTAGPTPVHDTADLGQGFGFFSYLLSPTTRLSLITGAVANHFQIPDNPGQPQVFTLAGFPNYPSAIVDENQFEQNYFGILALQGLVGSKFSYQVAPFSRYSTVSFNPDVPGDLIFDGAASRLFRSSFANGIQADFSYQASTTHTLRLGGYFTGERAEIDNHELAFPADSHGMQTRTTPFKIVDNIALTAWTYSGYLQDEWKPLENLTLNVGVRFDLYDGIVRADQASPRVAIVYEPIKGTTLHAAYARYFTPPPTELLTSQSTGKFENTTGAASSSLSNLPTPERDHYFDVGIIQQFLPGLTAGIDAYYRKARDLIDEGQFGPARILEAFNYKKGRIYGVEFTSSYTRENFSSYGNFAYAVAQGSQVESGQFNFDPDELKFIDSHFIALDHDQSFSVSAGASYKPRDWLLTVDGIYGSGLRRGFANTGNLPYYVQVDTAIERGFDLPGVGHMLARLAVVNLFDRTYEIRNGSGIGVFATEFGPRRAFLGGLRWDFPIGRIKRGSRP